MAIGDRFGLNDKPKKTQQPAIQTAPPAKPVKVKRTVAANTDLPAAEGHHFAKAVNYLGAFGVSAAETTSRLAGKISQILEPVVVGGWHLTVRAAPWVGRGAAWTFDRMARPREQDLFGNRHFDPVYFAKNIAKTAIVATVVSTAVPIIGFGAYYYNTWYFGGRDQEIWFSDTAKSTSHQFIEPGETGSISVAHDSFHSVDGKYIDKQGKIHSDFFEIDSNRFFFWFPNSSNPQQLGTQLNSMSPYGLKCHVDTTGIYHSFSRYFRIKSLRPFEFRPELINVRWCQEQTKVPAEFDGKIEEDDSKLTPSLIKTPSAQFGQMLRGQAQPLVKLG